MPDAPKTPPEVADQIRRYLAAHPNASDTAEGVQTWWLPQGVPDATVRKALDILVADGVVHTRELPDGNLIYAAQPGRAAHS
jgi:Fe2+ or Zn2+ uptake regulation protein